MAIMTATVETTTANIKFWLEDVYSFTYHFDFLILNVMLINAFVDL